MNRPRDPSPEVQKWIADAVQAVLKEKAEAETAQRVRGQVEAMWRTQMREAEEMRMEQVVERIQSRNGCVVPVHERGGEPEEERVASRGGTAA